MARIMSIDFGKKRTGIAVTDPLQIIANGLETVQTKDLPAFLKKYLSEEEVETIVVGMPKRLDNTNTHSTLAVKELIRRLKKVFPSINIEDHDERFTSKMAVRAMIDGGMKKKDRQIKENVDKISATIILQSYLESKQI